MKLDVESKDEKIHALQKEIIEMQGGGATEVTDRWMDG